MRSAANLDWFGLVRCSCTYIKIYASVSEYDLVTTVKILRSAANLGSLWFPQTVLLGGVCGNQIQQNKIFGGVLGPSADFSRGVMGKMKMPNNFFLKNVTFVLLPAFI
jgi:hypothetical protein